MERSVEGDAVSEGEGEGEGESDGDGDGEAEGEETQPPSAASADNISALNAGENLCGNKAANSVIRNIFPPVRINTTP